MISLPIEKVQKEKKATLYMWLIELLDAQVIKDPSILFPVLWPNLEIWQDQKLI